MTEDYEAFVRSKLTLNTKRSGIEVLDADLPADAFGFQRHLVRWALRTGKAALFAGCGLGKTLMELAWAHAVHRATGGRVLILAPLAVSQQHVRVVRAEPDEPWLLWCETDYEEDALVAALPGVTVVNGKDPLEVKERRLEQFVVGEARYLVTKASIAGYGLNFQHCARTAFIGPTFSYEKFYQAIRRCHRFGQRRSVHAHVVMSQTEIPVWDILTRKSDDHEAMAREMYAATRRATQIVDDCVEVYRHRSAWPLASWIRSQEDA